VGGIAAFWTKESTKIWDNYRVAAPRAYHSSRAEDVRNAVSAQARPAKVSDLAL
jgi:hypothetical protein